jgi:uncharacterized protein YqjF (DUF2071 family)
MEKMKLTSNLTVLVLLLLAFAIAWSNDLPYKSKDAKTQANYDEIASRSTIRKPDYGSVDMDSGIAYVKLNFNYFLTENYEAFVSNASTLFYVVPDTGTYEDTIYISYIIQKITGDSMVIKAVDYGELTYVTGLNITGTVDYFTFLKDR